MDVLSALSIGAGNRQKPQSVTATATTTIDRAKGDYVAVAMNASITTLTIQNWVNNEVNRLQLELTQDATGGRTIAWPAAVKWAGGVAPTLSGANKVDHIMLVSRNGGTTIYGFIMGLNY